MAGMRRSSFLLEMLKDKRLLLMPLAGWLSRQDQIIPPRKNNPSISLFQAICPYLLEAVTDPETQTWERLRARRPKSSLGKV